MNWNEKEILITGGTGSLGKTLTNLLIEKYQPHGIRIYSRDELKQFEMKNIIKEKFPDAKISFLIGDIRDRKRLELACKNVNLLIHCAALKHVGSGEDNPIETIQTNVIGSQNVLLAAIENKIEKVIGISTDKSVYAINLYGATKLCMERLFLQGNEYTGGRQPDFSICRYGNVLGSRGSVIPLFKEQAKTGTITITAPEATRFWITLENVAQFVIDRIEKMKGGEIFVPKMPSCSIRTIAEAVVAPGVKINVTKLAKGEKMHETLITYEEAKRTIEHQHYFEITNQSFEGISLIRKYDSFNNSWRLIADQIERMI